MSRQAKKKKLRELAEQYKEGGLNKLPDFFDPLLIAVVFVLMLGDRTLPELAGELLLTLTKAHVFALSCNAICCMYIPKQHFKKMQRVKNHKKNGSFFLPHFAFQSLMALMYYTCNASGALFALQYTQIISLVMISPLLSSTAFALFTYSSTKRLRKWDEKESILSQLG